MATLRFRPRGKRNPELVFRAPTRAGALASARKYMRRANIQAFTDASGVIQPIRGSKGYRGSVGKSRRRHKTKPKRKRRRSNPFRGRYNVWLGGKMIDSVFYSGTLRGTRRIFPSVQEVKRSLVDHDGYDAAIRVTKAKK